MPIITLQRQMRELGRIRTGNQVAGGNGRRRPNKLETFRLTSTSRALVEAAAEAYGGTVTPWDNNGSQEFEVVTTTAALDIIIPPGQPVSQWYELWSGGGCQRRCDGQTEVLTMGPCLCPADIDERLELAQKGQACKPTTRLNVILPKLPDLGVWRLESHGFYAAVELAGSAELLAAASASGRLIPARLRLEQREKKRPGKPINRFAVPIIEFVETRFAELALEAGGGNGQAPQLGSGAAPRPAVPALPSTTLPPASDMRAPLPPQTAQEPSATAERAPTPVAASAGQDAPAPAGGDVVEASFVADPAEPRVDIADVVAKVLDAAGRSGMKGAVTDPQKARLVAAFGALEPAAVGAGIRAVFGHADGKLKSAAEAQALVTVADSLGDEDFRSTWAAIAASDQQPAAAGQEE